MASEGERLHVHLFLVVFLLFLVVDAFRPVSRVHQRFQEKIDFLLDVSGLWQGPWRLFGPDVDKVNLRASAQVTFADHAVASWRSPDWSQMSGWQKFWRFRHMNYYGNVLKDGQQAAWHGLADYLARTVGHPQGKKVPVVSVVLSLEGAVIPAPGGGAAVAAVPYLVFSEARPFHAWGPAQ